MGIFGGWGRHYSADYRLCTLNMDSQPSLTRRWGGSLFDALETLLVTIFKSIVTDFSKELGKNLAHTWFSIDYPIGYLEK